MKTRLFTLLTAAMLLLSVNVSAQTNKAAEKKVAKTEKKATTTKAPKKASTETPLKGDVNEDGVVDVADIAAVIAIMKNGGGTGEETKYYWYVGTTKPTSLSQATVVDSYESEYTYTNNSGSKAHIFVLTNSNKTVTFINPQLNAPVDQLDVDETTIPGYKIFETAVGTANTGSIKIRVDDAPTYYWYAGQTQPTTMSSNPTVDDSNFTNNKWHTLGNATTIAKTITGGTSGLDWYVAVPTEVGLKATAGDLSTPNTSWDNIGTITINSISYTIWRTNSTYIRQAVYMAKIS